MKWNLAEGNRSWTVKAFWHRTHDKRLFRNVQLSRVVLVVVVVFSHIISNDQQVFGRWERLKSAEIPGELVAQLDKASMSWWLRGGQKQPNPPLFPSLPLSISRWMETTPFLVSPIPSSARFIFPFDKFPTEPFVPTTTKLSKTHDSLREKVNKIKKREAFCFLFAPL